MGTWWGPKNPTFWRHWPRFRRPLGAYIFTLSLRVHTFSPERGWEAQLGAFRPLGRLDGPLRFYLKSYCMRPMTVSTAWIKRLVLKSNLQYNNETNQRRTNCFLCCETHEDTSVNVDFPLVSKFLFLHVERITIVETCVRKRSRWDNSTDRQIAHEMVIIRRIDFKTHHTSFDNFLRRIFAVERPIFSSHSMQCGLSSTV